MKFKFVFWIVIVLLNIQQPTMADNGKKTIEKLRSMVFNLKPNDIGIVENEFGHTVWGLVMERGFSDGWYTLISLADGTTSIYFSNGGGVIGAGEHESVQKASVYLLSGAQHYHNQATKVSTYPNPSDGEVKFYFLTFKGIYSYSAAEEKLGNNKDKLSKLFFAAHGVITELRKVKEK